MKSVLLQETLHIHNDSNESHEDIEALENGTTVKRVQKNENLFLNWTWCDIALSELCQ